MSGQPATDPDLAPINARLEVVHDLVQRISDEVGPRTFVGADGIIERHRPEVYAAMEAVGMAAYEFVQSQPSPERLAAAQALVTGKLREISLTSPITFHGLQRKRPRMSYFEVIEHLRAGRAAGADVSARVLDDYYTHTFIGQAFINRLALLSRQLVDEVARCRTAIAQPLHLISMQYIGGDELLPLARDARRLADLEVTSLDSSVDAVRHAEQKLRPAFGSQIRFVKADPVQWLGGPACPADSACVVYDVSLVERLATKRAVSILGVLHRVLRMGGVLLLGSTAGKVPVAEQMIRDWLLGWDWRYRSESEWRELFAQTPFGADRLSFEYESLGINALIRLEKAG